MAIMANTTVLPDCQPRNSTGGYEDEQSKLIISISMGMLALLSVCGIVGNALVIFVFSRQKQKLSSTIFILTLAVTDFITALITMPYTVTMELLDYKIEYDVLCKLYQFMKTSTIPFSAFVMVAIAFDRFLCIVYPFKHFMTIKRAKITVLMLSVLAFIVGFLCSLMIGTYQVYQLPPKLCGEGGGQASYDTVSSYKLNSSSSANIGVVMETLNTNNTKSENSKSPKPGDVIHSGVCKPTTLLFSEEFFHGYQKAYSSLFGICAVMVITLYVLTYKTVLTQRRKRLHLSNKCCGFLSRSASQNSGHDQTEISEVTNLNKNDHSPTTNGKDGESIRLKEQNFQGDTNDASNTNNKVSNEVRQPGGVSKAKLKKLRVANIKTALMLSIVALIYIVAFTPAWMMALHVLPLNLIVYYLYFSYSVANPVIYAFLNQNFRTHLQTLFKCGR